MQVRSVSDGIDPATSTGRLMLNMLATLAEYERELIVERVTAGIAAARQNGTRFGRPLSDPAVIADKLAIAADARAKGRTAEDAARLEPRHLVPAPTGARGLDRRLSAMISDAMVVRQRIAWLLGWGGVVEGLR